MTKKWMVIDIVRCWLTMSARKCWKVMWTVTWNNNKYSATNIPWTCGDIDWPTISPDLTPTALLFRGYSWWNRCYYAEMIEKVMEIGQIRAIVQWFLKDIVTWKYKIYGNWLLTTLDQTWWLVTDFDIDGNLASVWYSRYYLFSLLNS